MFTKILALFALLAVAFAAPNPNPQVLTYAAAPEYFYPSAAAGVVPSVYSPVYGGPLTYAAVNGYPATYFVKK